MAWERFGMGKIWYGMGKRYIIYMYTSMVWKDMVRAAMSCLIECIHIQDAVNYFAGIQVTLKGLGIQKTD